MNRWWTGIALILVDTVFTSVSHVCFRTAALHIDVVSPAVVLQPWLVVGVLVQLAMLPVALLAYRYGDMVVLLPLMSLAHVWNTLAGVLWLDESPDAARLAGTALVLSGSVVLGWPSREAA